MPYPGSGLYPSPNVYPGFATVPAGVGRVEGLSNATTIAATGSSTRLEPKPVGAGTVS